MATRGSELVWARFFFGVRVLVNYGLKGTAVYVVRYCYWIAKNVYGLTELTEFRWNVG